MSYNEYSENKTVDFNEINASDHHSQLNHYSPVQVRDRCEGKRKQRKSTPSVHPYQSPDSMSVMSHCTGVDENHVMNSFKQSLEIHSSERRSFSREVFTSGLPGDPSSAEHLRESGPNVLLSKDAFQRY